MSSSKPARKTKHLSIEAVKALFPKRVIAFRPEFARIGQGTPLGRLGSNAAIFLSQALYWAERTTDPDGWFYKTQEEWSEETGLTEDEQPTARKALKRHNLIEEELRGSEFEDGRRSQGKLHYRVNWEQLRIALERLIDDTPKLAAMEAQKKREKAERRREQLAQKRKQKDLASEHVPGNVGNMNTGSNSLFCSPRSAEHVSSDNGNVFPPNTGTDQYIESTIKISGTTTSSRNAENTNFASTKNGDDDVDFSNPQKPADAGKVLGQINADDARLAKKNERVTKHAPADQPLLTEATLTVAPAPKSPGADPELLRRVQAIGVTGKIAGALVAEFPEECARQLDYLPYQKSVSNPGAWFPGAVRGAYPAPEAFTKAVEAREREQAQREAQLQQERQRQQEHEKQRALDEENAVLDAEFAALPEGEQVAFDQEVLRRNPGLSVFFQRKDRATLEGALASHRRQLLRSGWTAPAAGAPRYLDSECSSRLLTTAYEAYAATHDTAGIESTVQTQLQAAGITATPDSEIWKGRRVAILRTKIKSGQLKLPVPAEEPSESGSQATEPPAYVPAPKEFDRLMMYCRRLLPQVREKGIAAVESLVAELPGLTTSAQGWLAAQVKTQFAAEQAKVA